MIYCCVAYGKVKDYFYRPQVYSTLYSLNLFLHTMKLISQLSKETGIPIGTIRFYEKSGLFSGQTKKEVTTNNYVYYGDEVIDKLRFIQMAKAVGFSLSEIKEVIDTWYKKELTKKSQIEVLDLKLLQIDQKIKELEAMKKQITLCKFNIENRDS